MCSEVSSNGSSDGDGYTYSSWFAIGTAFSDKSYETLDENSSLFSAFFFFLDWDSSLFVTSSLFYEDLDL